MYDHSVTLCQGAVNSVSLLARIGGSAEHLAMPLSAAEIRRLNFAQAVEKAGGVPAFCKKHELNPDYVRQILNGKGQKSGRNIGDRAARKIEVMLRKEPNWLDQIHGPVGVEAPLGPRPARTPSAGFKEAQQDNSMHSVRLALGFLFAELASNRPDEAGRVAEDIRALVPENFQDRGLMLSLLSALDKGVAARSKGRKRARPGAKLPSQK